MINKQICTDDEKRETVEKSKYICYFLFLCVLQILSILWINYNGRCFYSNDMYVDSYIAKLMWEQKTLFPSNWLFGNQYYVIATPVLSALLYGLFHNSFLSMATAASIMGCLLIVLFIWMYKPAAGKLSIIVGLSCFTGGVILGGNAAEYQNGLQSLYTMCSFYACYMIGILLSLGLYLRIKNGMTVHPIMIGLSAVVNFALGMHSLRETLILNLPLVLYELLDFIKDKNKTGIPRKPHKYQLLFVLLLLIANLAGVRLVKFLNIPSNPIIGQVSPEANLGSAEARFIQGTDALLTITGLTFLRNGIKWYPLFGAAVLIVACVIFAVGSIFKNREENWISDIVVISFISVMSVYFVGITLFDTRALYYFVWFLLASASIVYIFEKADFGKRKIRLLSVALLIAGLGNYVCNYVPNYISYALKNNIFEDVTQQIVDGGVEYLYVDIHTSPRIAIYSDDQIVSGTFTFDFDKSENYLLKAIDCVTPTDVFDENDNDNAVICLSNWSMDYLKNHATDEYYDELMKHLTFIAEYRINDETLSIYRADSQLIKAP